jgi:hypothetical protein
LRVVVATTLLVVAVLWPILELGPEGPVLFELSPAHGVVAADLLVLIPLAIAIFVIRPLLRRPSR